VPGRPLIGISIDGWGDAPDQQEIGGKTYNMVREIAALPSADLVTRAGAGGQFHRRLSESIRGAGTLPIGRRELTPAKLQKFVRRTGKRLQEALLRGDAGEAGRQLRKLEEAGAGKLWVQAKWQARPSTPKDAKVNAAKRELAQVKQAQKAERRRRKAAERELAALRLIRSRGSQSPANTRSLTLAIASMC
jgi:hypothetical protein